LTKVSEHNVRIAKNLNSAARRSDDLIYMGYHTDSFFNDLPSYTAVQTRSSAVADRPHDAQCHWKFIRIYTTE